MMAEPDADFRENTFDEEESVDIGLASAANFMVDIDSGKQ